MLVRRSPVWYGAATRLFDRLERAPLDERRAWTDNRLRTVLSGASRTEYGRRVGAATSIGDWPVLQKNAVRVAPGAFVRGSRRIAAPGATSGTTGVPLDVWRSFRSVAVEQAAIDLLLARVGVRLRASRVAVLRGDDIKDPGDREAPFWVPAAGGRRLVFSSNHLSAETVSAFAAALTEFEPHVLYAYPPTLESLCRLLRGLARVCPSRSPSAPATQRRRVCGRSRPMCSDLASSTTTGWPSACPSRTPFRLAHIGSFPVFLQRADPVRLGCRR